MKLRLLSLLLLISGVVHGQTPPGYIKANMRFKWVAGVFDSALHVPQYNGTPSGIRNGAWVGDGAVAVDTVNNLFYFRSSGAWHSTSSGSGWLLTGNAGTTSSNFIGTTDNQPLSFRVNNRWAGRIYTNGSVYLGDSAGVNDVQEDESNVGIGRFALKNVTVSSGNVASGESALYNLTVGFGNVAGGLETLYNLTAGSYNTAIGTSSGNNAKQKVDAKNQILIGANTYGTRDSITVLGADFIKETIVRGKLIDSTLSAGSGTKAVRWNSSTGEFTYADTSEVTTPTWQQTLTAGSTLTQDNTITSTGYDFSFNGQNIQFNATDGVDLTGTIAGTTSTISVDGSQLTLRNSRSGATSGLDIRADSIMIEPHLGLLKIDTLAAASSQNQLIGWTSTSGANRGKVGAVTIGTGLSLSSGTLNSVWTASGNDVYSNNSGNVGIGTSTPTALTHLISTTEQLRIGYDASNYYKTTVGSTGGVTFDAVGSGSQFSFSDNVNVTGTGNVFYGRWKARVDSTTSSATPTINTDNVDLFKITALAAAITSMTTNLSGTPNDGDILELVITDNGTARAITWGASFVSTTVTLPSTTTLGVTLTVVLQYYKSSSYGNNKWHCVNYY